MAAIGIAAGRSTLLGPTLRTATVRSLIAPRARFSLPNPNLSSSRLNTSSLSQARTEFSASRFLRRELSTHQPFHSVIASACLVSKLPSDVTASYDEYMSPGESYSFTAKGGFARSFQLPTAHIRRQP